MLRGLQFAAYVLVAALTISVWHRGAVAQDLTPFITYELASANPSVHAPIFIRFSLKNGLPFDLVIDEVQNANGSKGFRAKLTRPDWRTEDGPERSVSELWGTGQYPFRRPVPTASCCRSVVGSILTFRAATRLRLSTPGPL